jgi:hypothetical protein
MKKSNIILLILVFFITGCASLGTRTAQVAFEDPLARLALEDVEPTVDEAAGIILRFKYPEGVTNTYEDEMVVFNRIEGETGKKTVLTQVRRDTFGQGSSPEAAIITSELTIKEAKERIKTKAELDTRGGVRALLEGTHATKVGRFTITAWERSPVFPEGPVKIGDSWSYDETMSLEIKSWLIKDRDPKPTTIKARSTLKGFALVRGKRCAVVSTVVYQEEQHSFRMLFIPAVFTTRTAIEDTLYFDHVRGEERGRVTSATARTTRPDGQLLDIMKMQSVEIKN